MLTENKNIIIILLSVFILSIMWFGIISNPSPKNFNRIPLVINNNITNHTDIKYLDTIVHVGLKHLKIEGKTIIIKELINTPPNFYKNNQGYEMNAYIVGNKTQYIIFVKSSGRESLIETLSHEMIHLFQFSSGTLELCPTHLIWKGKLYGPNDYIPYEIREWEKEATYLGNILQRHIKKDLLPK